MFKFLETCRVSDEHILYALIDLYFFSQKALLRSIKCDYVTHLVYKIGQFIDLTQAKLLRNVDIVSFVHTG